MMVRLFATCCVSALQLVLCLLTFTKTVDSQQLGVSRPSIKGHACGTLGGRLQSLQQYASHIEQGVHAALESVEHMSLIAWYTQPYHVCDTQAELPGLGEWFSVNDTAFFSLFLVVFWLQVTVTYIPAPSFILCCQLGSCALFVKVAALAGMVDAEPLEWEKSKKFALIVFGFIGTLFSNITALQVRQVTHTVPVACICLF